MKLKLYNSKGENKIVDIALKNLIEVENRIIAKYGHNSIVARDYDKGVIICSNGICIEDIAQNKKFKTLKKYGL